MTSKSTGLAPRASRTRWVDCPGRFATTMVHSRATSSARFQPGKVIAESEIKCKKRIVRNRKRDHVGTLRCRRDLLILLEMRIACRNEKHAVELKLLGSAARDDEMPLVHRVEGAAHDTYASVFLHTLASNLALAAHEILDRRKRSRAHGAACMKLLGADANLGA